jgi:hypothetical protein
VAVSVLTTSLLVETTIVSSRLPTSSVALTVPECQLEPHVAEHGGHESVNVTVTVYSPALKAGTENTPSVLVTVSKLEPVPLFLTTTEAPGTTPPPVSTTTPEMDVVAVPCP